MLNAIFAACALFHSINPTSVSELLSYYTLNPNTETGHKALKEAWELLDPEHLVENPIALPAGDVEAMIRLITNEQGDDKANLSDEMLVVLETLSKRLKHHTLKGHSATTVEEVQALPVDEVDVARGLLLHELPLNEVIHYEAMLDLLALQVLAKLPPRATHLDMVQAINQLIFFELEFRFPPHSLYAKDIDTYTFLPSVMDSRRGVCLGVSIIYIALGQRLGLPLDVITPPGHIFVRYKDRNIETTARGIHVPSDHYLSIHTKSLQERNYKEVIGFAYQNKGSMFWYKEKYEEAAAAFEVAKTYLPDDHLINMLLGYNYLFIGKVKEGTALLTQVAGQTMDGGVHADTTPIDYLKGRVDIDSLKIMFKEVDETRDSIEAKKAELETVVKKWPKFRDGWFHLAVCHLQLGRGREGLDALKRYHALDPTNPIVEYYLSVLSFERYKYIDAKRYFTSCEKLLQEAGHKPKALKGLRNALIQVTH
ncbi:MAG: hypothetical protein SP1CHLAM54_02370 [Chlamydiia bacterium]|nr:hypothetical protein [Chlamydiia bacterium]MCH9615154.1 hypothetical protein [Chlamydiia bacterium]MCH9628524.1 hypothetical protein [Chlamydiia bacterium]